VELQTPPFMYRGTLSPQGREGCLRVENAARRKTHGILITFRLFCEYSNLEYVRVRIIYTVQRAEYSIRIPVAAP